METSLATALAAVETAATKAGIDPVAARREGVLLAAAVAESAPGAFVDWARESGEEESAAAFMGAASAGRRFRSSPTPLVSQLRLNDPVEAMAYGTALADVCAAACLLGKVTPQVAGAASMAAAAQTTTSAGIDAPTSRVEQMQREFTERAPGLLDQVMGQLRATSQRLREAGIPAQAPTFDMSNPFDLDDASGPGAFDLTAPGAQPSPGEAPLGASEPVPQTQVEETTAPDPEPEPEQPAKSLDELMAELDALIGLGSVKSEIKKQAAVLRVEALRQDKGLRSTTITRHLIFVGNPGTGKTTVARLVAGIYRALGLLSKGQLVEVDRSELVAGYLGQTALKTAEVMQRATGGVLFIDEAYALNGDQYGEEAINTLVKEMEDKRDDLVVIVAGYPLPMAEFISNNPGLESRFRTTIAFDDYSDQEIVDILQLMADKADYDFGDGAEDKFRTILARQPRDFSFGNGRFARNMLEAAIGRHAWRLREVDDPTVDDLRTLLAEDFAETLDDDVVDWSAAPEPPADDASPAEDEPIADTTDTDQTGETPVDPGDGYRTADRQA